MLTTYCARGEHAIFSDGTLLRPAAFPPDRIVGDYALLDDGWRCRLRIRPGPNGQFEADFFSFDRTEGRFEARVSLDERHPHHVVLHVDRFNELDVSSYVGYAFTRGPAAIAGTGDWKGITFGFYARRQPPCTPGPDVPGALSPAGYLGTYTLWCDGLHGRVRLTRVDGNTVHGLLREPTGATFPLVAEIDPAVPHHAVITVHDVPDDRPATMSVFMFVRPRTALSGWLDWAGTRLGCYLTRTGWDAPAEPGKE